MRVVLWIVGEPGAGKTTLARALLGPNPVCTLPEAGPRWTFSFPPGVAAAGHYTGQTFDGADTIGYSQGPAAIEWWAEFCGAHHLTILDGDRLSHRGIVARLMREPVILACAYLVAPPELAEERRASRGSNQNATWLKGRATKARRFFERFPGALKFELDGTWEPDGLAIEVRAQLLAGLDRVA